MMHAHELLLLETLLLGGERRPDSGEREVMESWARSLRAPAPSPAVWQRILCSIDADEAARN